MSFFVADSRESKRLPLAVNLQDQPPTLQLQTARVNYAQSWTALFQAFYSSHQQPSAYLKQEYTPATSRPNWTNPNGLHEALEQ